MDYPAGNRFAVSTPDDHQASLWITSLLSLMFSVVVLAARVVVKWGAFGADDIALGIAYVLATAHWITMYMAMSRGLGKSATLLSHQMVVEMSKVRALVYTSRILLLVVTGLTKCTVLLFIRQIFTRGGIKAWTICNAAAIATAVWAAAAPLIASLGCRPKRTIASSSGAYCSGDIGRWRAIATIDIILEVGLAVLPAYLFSSLQMKRREKLTVIALFSFRIGTALPISAYVVSYAAYLSGGRPGIGMVTTLVWQEVWIAYALMSATVPILKGFVGRFTTAALVRIDQSGSGMRSGTYPSAATLGSGVHGRAEGTRGEAIELRLIGHAENSAEVWHEEERREAESIASNGSEKMIIQRRMEWEVRTDAAQ
ncbi:hypothetical protein LTR65_003729 [Meristemomyces frigidus]